MEKYFKTFSNNRIDYNHKQNIKSIFSGLKQRIISFKISCVVALLVIGGTQSVAAQNKNCSCTMHSIKTMPADTNSYVLKPGMVLCVDSGMVFTGKVSLAGGELCVSGTANPSLITIAEVPTGPSSGKITINSKGLLTTRSDFSMGRIVIDVSSQGVLNVRGDLSIAIPGSRITNAGTINIQKRLILNKGCTVKNDGNINYQSLQSEGEVNGNGNVISRSKISEQQQ